MKIGKANETLENKVDSLQAMVWVNIGLQIVILIFTLVVIFNLVK